MQTILRFFLLSLIVVGGASAQIVSQPPSPTGGLALPGGKSGRFFTTPVVVAPGGAAVVANRLYATPIFLSAPATLASLSFNITTGNASAWNARMCVYADRAGIPGALVVDSGQISVASGSVTGAQTVSSLSVALASGWYWGAWMADSASEQLSSVGTTSGVLLSMSILGAASVSNIASPTITNGVYADMTFGACPATFPTLTYKDGGTTPIVIFGF